MITFASITSVIYLGLGLAVLAAETRSKVRWEKLEDHVQLVRRGSYTARPGGEINFTAIRFHLGYVNLRLIDTARSVNKGLTVQAGVSRSSEGGKEVLEILNYGLEGVWRRITPSPIALVPAGWSRSQRVVEHIGLLRIDGEELTEISDKPSLSTILCLHDKERFGDYDALVPVAFFAESVSESDRAAKCPNAVQVGPRVVEEGGREGIAQAELRITKYKRVIFAVDAPQRKLERWKSRHGARNGYLIVTSNPVYLYDIQKMLLDSSFYGSSEPHWAVNLAGASGTGMILDTRRDLNSSRTRKRLSVRS